MVNCPRCHHPLERSTTLPGLNGRAVLACRKVCRMYAVEVPGVQTEWLEAGPGLLERLARSAREGEAVKAIATSLDDDPRWVEMVG